MLVQDIRFEHKSYETKGDTRNQTIGFRREKKGHLRYFSPEIGALSDFSLKLSLFFAVLLIHEVE